MCLLVFSDVLLDCNLLMRRHPQRETRATRASGVWRWHSTAMPYLLASSKDQLVSAHAGTCVSLIINNCSQLGPPGPPGPSGLQGRKVWSHYATLPCLRRLVLHFLLILNSFVDLGKFHVLFLFCVASPILWTRIWLLEQSLHLNISVSSLFFAFSIRFVHFDFACLLFMFSLHVPLFLFVHSAVSIAFLIFLFTFYPCFLSC